jgi:hypothetical protein
MYQEDAHVPKVFFLICVRLRSSNTDFAVQLATLQAIQGFVG